MSISITSTFGLRIYAYKGFHVRIQHSKYQGDEERGHVPCKMWRNYPSPKSPNDEVWSVSLTSPTVNEAAGYVLVKSPVHSKDGLGSVCGKWVALLPSICK